MKLLRCLRLTVPEVAHTNYAAGRKGACHYRSNHSLAGLC